MGSFRYLERIRISIWQQHLVGGNTNTTPISDIKFGIKIGSDNPKWDKSVIFKDQFQYILARRA